MSGSASVQAAEREVLEETGVRATSAAVLAFRQAHGFAFGKSDFFFVVALTCAPAARLAYPFWRICSAVMLAGGCL